MSKYGWTPEQMARVNARRQLRGQEVLDPGSTDTEYEKRYLTEAQNYSDRKESFAQKVQQKEFEELARKQAFWNQPPKVTGYTPGQYVVNSPATAPTPPKAPSNLSSKLIDIKLFPESDVKKPGARSKLVAPIETFSDSFSTQTPLSPINPKIKKQPQVY